jgi:hypothetical protein
MGGRLLEVTTTRVERCVMALDIPYIQFFASLDYFYFAGPSVLEVVHHRRVLVIVIVRIAGRDSIYTRR